MRENIYKAKGVGEDKNRWFFGNYLSWQETTYCFKEDYDKHPENTKHYIVWDDIMDWGLPNKHFRADINPDTLCQYVGRKDKNKHKIFEGDILKGERYIDYGQTGEFVPYITVVEWNSDKCGFEPFCSFDNYSYDLSKCEIIGNIYDNTESFAEPCCKVGDSAYFIWNYNEPEIQECKIKEFQFIKRGVYVCLDYVDCLEEHQTVSFSMDKLDNSWFLDAEKVEARLNKLKNNGCVD